MKAHGPRRKKVARSVPSSPSASPPADLVRRLETVDGQVGELLALVRGFLVQVSGDGELSIGEKAKLHNSGVKALTTLTRLAGWYGESEERLLDSAAWEDVRRETLRAIVDSDGSGHPALIAVCKMFQANGVEP